MRRKATFLTIAAMFCCPALQAHLCNDVFVQAKDNLAVKVDIRDGQLRIADKATFRVYLLNTMDRFIATIGLEVISDQFDATVTPSPDWHKAPYLETTKKGGKKVYFEVTLKRKGAVKDGRYKIGLRLFNPKKKSMIFKTIDLDSAASLHRLTPRTISVDGQADKAEWGKSELCTGFYEYVKAGRYFENREADAQARFRVAMDGEKLYCLLGRQGGEDADEDIGTIYIARGPDETPLKVAVNLRTGDVNLMGKTVLMSAAVGGKSDTVECAIPLAENGLKADKTLHLNFTRTLKTRGKETVTYWRGNKHSVANPIVYDRFVLAK